MKSSAMMNLIREKLLREMDEEIFTVASPGRVRVAQEDLEAAEETLAVQESSKSHKSQRLNEFVRGLGPASGVRAMPEYQQFVEFVMNRNIPGIHPDDVMVRWKRMFPDIKLASGQIEQLYAALEDDGVLDKPVTYESKKANGAMNNTSKFPFTQTQLSENKEMRRFSKSLSDQELVWHRDREDRVVRMVEGKGWYIQLDGQLPRRMRLGESYHIPAASWHRIIRRAGATDLSVIVEKVKKGAEVTYKGKKATVKVPDARGPFVGIDPAGPDDMKMVPGDELDEPKKKKTEAAQVEGLMDEALDDLLGDVLSEKKGKKKGLWANIHAKRARGERPAKPGEKGYPAPGALDSARGKG